MAWSKGTLVSTGTAAAAVLAVTGAAAAGAAVSPGWRIVYRHNTPASYSAFSSVAAWAKSRAWAVGGTGVAGDGLPIAASYHRGKWTMSRMPKASGALFAVSADGRNDAWAGGLGDLLHFRNGRWSLAKTWRSPDGGPPAPLVTGVTAFSPRNVWVFGGTGVTGGTGTWHLHGRTWTQVKGVGGSVFMASALSPKLMWATGGKNSTQIIRYAGGAWRAVSNPALSGLQFGAIYASAKSGVWVTAEPTSGTGPQELLRLQAGVWTSYPVPWTVRLLYPSITTVGAISPDGRGGLWIPTESYTTRNWMLHFRAGVWSRVPVGKNPIRSVALIPGTRSLWGAGGLAHPRHSDGAVWAYGRVR